MKVLELFAGTRSIGKAFEAHGHDVFAVEWDKRFENIDLYADILTVTAEQIVQEFGYPDIIWASPDCTTYSVAAISKHRRKEADGKGNGLGVGNPGDPMNTLTGGDRHAVAFQTYQNVFGALCSTDYKWVQQQQVEQDKLIVEQQNIRWIVRRLTPTECARLQGFVDRWAVPDTQEDFTDEEYRFWLDVRNTHAEINGKATKEYTKEQMLKWYNGLHTDSSEYKLWGNGIALPCALFVLRNIADVLNQ